MELDSFVGLCFITHYAIVSNEFNFGPLFKINHKFGFTNFKPKFKFNSFILYYNATCSFNTEMLTNSFLWIFSIINFKIRKPYSSLIRIVIVHFCTECSRTFCALSCVWRTDRAYFNSIRVDWMLNQIRIANSNSYMNCFCAN